METRELHRLNRKRKRVHFVTPACSTHTLGSIDVTSHYPTPPNPPSTSTPLQSSPSLSSILLCQPRSCTTIRLWSPWYWGWCRYLWAEQLVKSAAHTHTRTVARTHTFQPYLSLCPLLSVPVSGVYLFIFTSPPSPSTACNKPPVALSTWHGPKLKWWAPPTPTFYFTPWIAASAWANTPTGIKLYE